MTNDYYNLINIWKQVYSGFYDEWHKVKFHTLDGYRHREMQTMKMAKFVSEEMARLVFNEKVDINISPDEFSVNVHKVLENNGFNKNFQDYLEFMFALGGMVIKPYAELNRSGEYEIKLCYVTAESFLPISYTNKKVDEGVFITVTKKGKFTYTLLEFNEWDGVDFVIRNELYKSEQPSEIGIKVSLSEIYPNLDELVTITGLTRPPFVYFKPNLANNFELNSPLGISLFANSMDTIKALDVAFDSFMREFKLGKKRILVPQYAIKTVVDPEDGCLKRYFDASDEVYQAFNFDSMDNQKIHDNSVELRVEEHIEAINTLLNILAMQTGFSSGTFTFDGEAVKTATEVVSENSKTFRSKNSHEIIIEEGIKELVISIGEIASLYDIFTIPDKFEVSVDFDDSIADDRESNKAYYSGLYTQKLVSRKYAMMKILGFTEEQANEMIAEIKAEEQTATPDVTDLFRGGS